MVIYWWPDSNARVASLPSCSFFKRSSGVELMQICVVLYDRFSLLDLALQQLPWRVGKGVLLCSWFTTASRCGTGHSLGHH